MASNLFNKAKEKPAAKKAKKDDKLNVTVEGKEFAEKLKKFAELNAQLEDLKADLEMSKGFVKDTALAEYAALVEKTKTNVGSFSIFSEDGSTVMFVPTKKYIKIDEASANVLKETYGADIVTEKEAYSFNNEILEDHMEEISELINSSKKMTKAEKENLIVAKVEFSVASDTLDKVYTIAKESKRTCLEVIKDIQPVCMLKGAKVAKIEDEE